METDMRIGRYDRDITDELSNYDKFVDRPNLKIYSTVKERDNDKYFLYLAKFLNSVIFKIDGPKSDIINREISEFEGQLGPGFEFREVPEHLKSFFEGNLSDYSL
ncbi:MAG: hypothetical protein ABEK36_02720 [Candidatus Aenigmatarchaeota archaeon]